MILSDDARDILERTLKVDFFDAVGHDPHDASVERTSDWRSGLKMLGTTRSINFFLDAREAIGSQLVLGDKQKEFNKWNDIVDEANRTLEPVVVSKIESGLPIPQRRRVVLGNEIVLQIRMAVVERQLRAWHTSDFFLRVFEWLERGHLVCGGTDEYPQGSLVIY